MNWYYADNNKPTGPISEEQFISLVRNGTISHDTLVWHSGLDQWKPWGQLAPQASQDGSAETVTITCSQCGRSFSKDNIIELGGLSVCAQCKPAFVQRIREGAAIPGVLVYASFWTRFAAKVVDGILLAFINTIVQSAFLLVLAFFEESPSASLLALYSLLSLIQFAISCAYTVFFLGRYGATPGKMTCKIKVVRSDGTPLSYSRALGRFLADLLSGFPTLLIGYLIAAFDSEKRALHDRLCDTRVVLKR